MRFKVLTVGASVYISVEPCNHHLRHIPLAFAHRFQTEVMMFRRVGFNRKKATGSVMRRLLLARTTETTSKTMAAMGERHVAIFVPINSDTGLHCCPVWWGRQY